MNPTSSFEIEVDTLDETLEVARLLGVVSMAPCAIGLVGDLGAGKTAFVRGVVRGVSPSFEDWVSSPTYALCNVYPSDPPVHHVDAYRLMGVDDLESIAFWESLEEGVMLVEWADRISDVLDACDAIVAIEKRGADGRRFIVEPRTERGTRVVSAWAGRLEREPVLSRKLVRA